MKVVNKEEINGFVIDTFNQYGLKEGDSQGICPLCSEDRKKDKEKCALYDWETGIGTCSHCSTSFQMHTFARKGEVDKLYTRPEATPIVEVGTKVEEWFKTRSITNKTLNELKITEGKAWMPQTSREENTIQFNYFMGGELLNIKYRDGRKNFKLHKGAEKVFYNIDSVVGHDYVVIAEGEMDVCSIHQCGMTSAVSVPNGATTGNNNLEYLDACVDYFEDKDRIIIAVDNDEAGQALQYELIRRLGAENCWLVNFDDCKDANEYHMKYGENALCERFNTAKQVPLENVLTFKDIEGDVAEFVKHGFKPGFQIGLPGFDDIFSTYTSQFITVTGIPSHGKSDFVDQMCVGYNKNYGWKTAYASPENSPTYLHAHKLMRKIWKGMPGVDDIDSPKWKDVSEVVNDNFYFIDMDKYSLESVLAKGAELVKRKGIKVLVIDPYNKVRSATSQSDVNVYTMDYLAQVEVFCKKYDVLAILVAHPIKMSTDIETKKPMEPTMYNIKGGGEWYDASYHGLLVHRDFTRGTVKVKVLKVKFQNLGENGAEAHFTWDKASGLYTPIEGSASTDKMPWE